MSHRIHWLVEAGVAILVVAVIVFAVVGALFVFNPVHSDPAALPSTAADTDSGGYASAVQTAKRLARSLLVDENLPGVSMAVAIDGRIVWAAGFGYADVDNRAPLTPDTRFRIGSVSKTLTAAGVAVLHDRGQIDLDAPVRRYVPSYPQKQWTITPRQLMGDVAGVHRIRGDDNDQPPFGHCTSLQDALAMFSDEPLLFEPGTAYRFASNGWVLLSAVIEGAAKEPFPDFMSREVFGPLEMTRTRLEGTNANPDLASAYNPMTAVWRKLGVDPDPAELPDYSCFAGAGAFVSTPSDLVRLGSAMLKPGLVKAETIATFQEPLRLTSGASTGFALGWRVDTIQFAGAQARVLRHRGSPVGGEISLTLFPERRFVVAAAANGSDLDTIDSFALQIAESFALVR